MTAALALRGSVATGQLQTEIRTGFIFPFNTFQLKDGRQTKAETRRAVRLNHAEVIVNQLMMGLNRQQRSPENCNQKPVNSWNYCVSICESSLVQAARLFTNGRTGSLTHGSTEIYVFERCVQFKICSDVAAPSMCECRCW